MATARPHRYQLQPYTGPASRGRCPDCGQAHARTFVAYVDTHTGERLPAEYGRCNREEGCGYHRSPYQSEADGLSYKERCYQQERADARPPAPPGGAAPRSGKPAAVRPPAPAAAAAVPALPAELLPQSLGHYEQNHFALLLQRHFGAGVADELLARFQIGTSAYWPGACVFWLVDEVSRVRGGQVVLFDETGHTAKTTRPDGSTKRHTSWVHTALQQRYQAAGQPLPAWLAQYVAHAEKSPCLFGLPQLATAPAGRPVALVEAPKTAVLCTPYFPEFTWLAVGALSYLNAARLAPLRPHSLVLFPDASASGRAYAEWSARAELLRRQGFRVEVSDMLEHSTTQAQQQAGVDLADLLLEQWGGYPPSWDEAPAYTG